MLLSVYNHAHSFFYQPLTLKTTRLVINARELLCTYKREEYTVGLGNKSHCLTAILIIIDTRL